MSWQVARNPRHAFADAIIALLVPVLLASFVQRAVGFEQIPTTQPATQGPFERVGTLEDTHIDTFFPQPRVFTPDGRLFLAENGRCDGVRLWDLRTLKPVTALLKQPGLEAFSLTADGKAVFTSGGGEVRLWDVATSKPRTAMKIDTKDFFFFEAAADGRRFVTIASDGRTLTVWNVARNQPTKAYEIAHDDILSSVQFDPTGQYLVAQEFNGHWFELLRADTGRAICPPFDTHAHDGCSAPYQAQFDPAGRRLAVPLMGGFRMLDCASGKTLAEGWADQELETDYISFSPDGSRIVFATWRWHGLANGPVFMFDAATAHLVRQTGSGGFLYGQLSPGGRFALCIHAEQANPQLIDLHNGATVQTFPSMQDYNGMARMSPDGQTIVVGAGAETISVWRVRHGGPPIKP